MFARTIRVVVADDHSGVRTGIRYLVDTAQDIQIVGEAEDGREAIKIVAAQKPDVLLLDVALPRMRGEQVARHIQKQGWDVKVLAISSYHDSQIVRGMLSSGAVGYITKDAVPAMLVDAIHGVARGETGWFSERVIEENRVPTPIRFTLSQRELHILALLNADNSENEISRSLSVPLERIRDHINFLMKKLNALDIADLLRIARQNNLI
jgi:DNA-binding NarL/FixJ family response regulator